MKHINILTYSWLSQLIKMLKLEDYRNAHSGGGSIYSALGSGADPSVAFIPHLKLCRTFRQFIFHVLELYHKITYISICIIILYII